MSDLFINEQAIALPDNLPDSFKRLLSAQQIYYEESIKNLMVNTNDFDFCCGDVKVCEECFLTLIGFNKMKKCQQWNDIKRTLINSHNNTTIKISFA
jgi:hypothetical protein